MATRDRVSLGILAGGRGSRLGGVDKAFLKIDGASLLARALAAAGDGFAEVMVSHNRKEDPRRRSFEGIGVRFLPDLIAHGQGPLAGLDALLHAARSPWLLTIPVDLADPSVAFADAMLHTDGAVARDADGLQPLVALWPVDAARRVVRDALAHGERAVHAVAARLGLREVNLAPCRLGNLNTPADLRVRA